MAEKVTAAQKALKKIRNMVEKPVKLSDTEKEKFKNVFGALTKLLEDSLKTILTLDRDEAYRFTNLIVQSLHQADASFTAGVTPPEIIEPGPKKPPTDAPVQKPDFESLRDKLTPEFRKKGEAFLDCFKQYAEVGDQIVCPDCTLQKMRACIRTADPTIIDEMDEAGRKLM